MFIKPSAAVPGFGIDAVSYTHLYKDENSLYQLIVHQSSCTAEEFNKVCNILSEYGSGRAFTAAGEAHLKEHGELISRKALQQLAKI